MCATGQQTDLSNEQTAFYGQLQQQDAQNFGEFQSIMPQLTGPLEKVISGGPSQQGFSQGELNSLNTTATEGVAQNYASASKALKENQAAEGGGNTYLPSGVNSQEQESLLSSSAQQQSSEQQQIQQAGYAQGNANFNAATSALEGEQGELNPNATAGEATSAGSAAGNTANQIAQENESWEAPLIGAVGSVAGAGLTGGLSAAFPKPAPCWVAAEIFGGWYEPRTVLVREWVYTHPRLLALYLRHGERMAAAIRRHRTLRVLFTVICKAALRQARKMKIRIGAWR
jgi:hypothetical protein